jgi:hypothetical protein
MIVAVFAMYSAAGLVVVARVPQILQLIVHLALAAIALLALRVGLHLALLHEAHDEVLSDQPILCTECGHVVPDMPFCAACGTAMQASSRWSRDARRESRPVRVDPEPAVDDQ